MKNVCNYTGKWIKLFCTVFLITALLLTVGCGREPVAPTAPPDAPPPAETDATLPTERTEATAEPEVTEIPQEPEETESPAETEAAPSADEIDASLNSLRQGMVETPQTFAVAYFGCTDGPEPVDPYEMLRQNAPQLCQDLPFVTAIPEERIIGDRWGELYCIVPLDTDASVSVNRVVLNDEGEYECESVLYRSESGEPIFLFSNGTGWELDTEVNIVGSDGSVVSWYPQLDDTYCVAPAMNDSGENAIMDFSSYAERLAADYFDRIADGWRLPEMADLVGTTWSWDGFLKDQRYVSYMITFQKEGASIRWNDGYDWEDQELSAARWDLSNESGFAVLSIDLGGFAGERRYDLLYSDELDMLYTMVDVSGGAYFPNGDTLYRILGSVKLSAPEPAEMVGKWERTATEVEGYREESEPGACVIEITGSTDADLKISYRNREFPDDNYKNKALEIEQDEMYYGCGNDQWVANVDHVGSFDTTFCVTLLPDGTLLLQNYFTIDGAPAVSYEFFSRAD